MVLKLTGLFSCTAQIVVLERLVCMEDSEQLIAGFSNFVGLCTSTVMDVFEG